MRRYSSTPYRIRGVGCRNPAYVFTHYFSTDLVETGRYVGFRVVSEHRMSYSSPYLLCGIGCKNRTASLDSQCSLFPKDSGTCSGFRTVRTHSVVEVVKLYGSSFRAGKMTYAYLGFSHNKNIAGQPDTGFRVVEHISPQPQYEEYRSYADEYYPRLWLRSNYRGFRVVARKVLLKEELYLALRGASFQVRDTTAVLRYYHGLFVYPDIGFRVIRLPATHKLQSI